MSSDGKSPGKPVAGIARTVSLIQPTTAGFVILAVSTGTWRTPLPRRSAERKQALAGMSERAGSLYGAEGVREATVFTAIVRPPGQPRPGQGPTAAYDAVLLVETDSPARAREVADRITAEDPEAPASERLLIAGSNVRRIGPVDPRAGGVFLFNFFTGPSMPVTLDVWQYTASWFEQETGLDNSTVILPDEESDSPFPIINHCRWDKLRQVLPALMFKRSFHYFVLATFRAAGVVPHPILYRVQG